MYIPEPTDNHCTCTKANCPKANGNDYELILKVMLKLFCPTVTVHIGDKKQIISFGAHHTTSYLFDRDDLMDVTQSKMPLDEWVRVTFLLSKGDGAIITIYNR